jgi:hypothetical protein
MVADEEEKVPARNRIPRGDEGRAAHEIRAALSHKF